MFGLPPGAPTPFANERLLRAYQKGQVQKALAKIPTPTGTSALARMSTCGFKVQWATSWVDVADAPKPAFALRPGDWTINVEFDRPGAPAGETKDNLARWFIRAGKLTPDTMWAKQMQLGPYPINKDGARRC